MLIEHTVAVAEVVFAILARIISDKAMFRALAVTEIIELTMAALTRQQCAFCHTKLKLTVAICQVCKAVGMDISYLILRIYKVVTAIDIAIMLNRKTATASLTE